MNVNRSPWEVILDRQWAVWGVFIWRPSGSQMEIFFFTASFWLCIWAGVSFWTEGCFRGRGLSPTILVLGSHFLVCCRFDYFHVCEDFLSFFNLVLSTGGGFLSGVCWRDIYTSAFMLFTVSFMHLFLIKWSTANWGIYPWVYFQLWMIEEESLQFIPWVIISFE